jgi:hypothetical protein
LTSIRDIQSLPTHVGNAQTPPFADGLANVPNRLRFAVDTVFEGKRKISPTTRTRTVLIPDMMMLEREAALKPAR